LSPFPVLSPNGEWMAGLFGIAGERQLCMISLFGTLADRQCVGMPDMTDVLRLNGSAMTMPSPAFLRRQRPATGRP
jgi:hypothetical protein